MKNKNQSQAGVNRHTSSEEVEMVKHSPGTQNQICANCGHHKKFHINEFTNESECLYGWRIGEKGVINIGCDCKKFIPQNHSPPSAQSDTDTESGVSSSPIKRTSGSAPSGDEEILKEVLESFENRRGSNLRVKDGWDANDIFDYIEECCKEAIQLTKQADDRKFEDWKKRLKEKLDEFKKDLLRTEKPFGELVGKEKISNMTDGALISVSLMKEEIDKLGGLK